MIDVFSDLAAQSIGSMPVIQPLIPPLFALASTLVSDTAPLVSNPIPLMMPEAALWETEPAKGAGSERAEIPTLPERWVMPPDLVPADAVHRDAPTLSLRRLIQPQPPVRNWSEQSPVEGIVSSPLSVSQAVVQRDTRVAPAPHLRPPDGLPQTPDRTAQPITIADKQGHATAKPEPLSHAQTEAPRSSNRSETGTDKDSGIAAGKHVASAAMPPIFLTPPPSIQPVIESERVVERDDVVGQQAASPSQTQLSSISAQTTVERRDVGQAHTMPHMPLPVRRVQETPIRPLLDSLPSLAESRPETLAAVHLRSGAASSPVIPVIPALPTLVAGQSAVVSGRPGNTSMLDERGEAGKAVEEGGLENADRRGRSVEKPRDEGDGVARSQTGNHAQQAPLDVWHDSPGQEVGAAKEEDEAQLVPLIRVNIGRVVVRGSTPAPQHNQVPAQKRVLRPAQSLEEYLKQRERGGR